MFLRWLVTQFAHEAVQRQLDRRGGPERPEAEDSREPEPPLPDPEVLLVFALPVESQGMVERLSRAQLARKQGLTEHRGLLDGRSLVLAETGVGSDPAQRATESLLQRYRVSWVVSAGFAAGLQPQLQYGDFVMPHEVVDAGQRCFSVGLRIDDSTLESTPRLHTGRLLTVDRLVRTVEDRRGLADEHHAVACDMESIAVAEVCRRRGLRFLAVRVVSDAAEESLPPDVERLVRQHSTAAKLGAATGAILRRPGAVKDLWKMHEDAVRTSRRLASFLTGVIRQLH